MVILTSGYRERGHINSLHHISTEELSRDGEIAETKKRSPLTVEGTIGLQISRE